jgi:uncharacterized protein
MPRLIIGRIVDWLILQPTRDPITPEGLTRRLIKSGSDQVEVWTQFVGGSDTGAANLFVLKFPGTAGRAERATAHPADHWPDWTVELWTVNPPGYGGSTGKASLSKLAPAARTVYDALQERAAGRPILVVGNSLGCASALHLAATVPVAGLILRNPPPLRQVILGRYGWRSLGLGALLVVLRIPRALDCIANARCAIAPAVCVSSGSDTLIPPKYQRLVFDAYAGEKQVLVLPDADHTTPMQPDEHSQYRDLLAWLRQRMTVR